MQGTRDDRVARTVTAGAIVLALHAAFLLALVAAMYRPKPFEPERLIEVMLLPRPVAQPPADLPEPPRTVWTPQIPAPRIEVAPEAPPASSVEGIGRALFGCDTGVLAQLTPDERAQCPLFPFGRTQDAQESSLRIVPPEPNSTFAQGIAKRDAPAVSFEHACAPRESPQANLGIPCYSFPAN